MKLQRIFMLGCMVLAIALVSCSGEDGKDGIDGLDGIDGTNGTNGTNGTDGADGADGADGIDGISCWDLNGDGVNDPEEDINGDNAFDALDCQGADGADGAAGPTAERIIMDTSGFGTAENPVTLIVDQLTQEVLDTHVLLFYITDGADYFSIPGTFRIGNNIYNYGMQIGQGQVILEDFNGIGWQPSIFAEVHIVLVPTTDAGGGGVVAKSQTEVKATLKDLGVDTSDYKEVIRYFGIEE